MKIDLKGKTLTIVVEDVTKGNRPSKSGKMNLCATTGGFTAVGTVDGKVVKVNLTVGTPA